MLQMGNVLVQEQEIKDTSYLNLSIKYKIERHLSSWELRNFLFWVVMDSNDFNASTLIIQSIYMDNFPTLIFTANDSNYEASLFNTLKQFRVYINDPDKIKSIDFDEKNVILNRWWKNYLLRLPRQPNFSENITESVIKE